MIKQEPENDFQVEVKVESLEDDKPNTGSMYEGHIITNDMVIGPYVIQKPCIIRPVQRKYNKNRVEKHTENIQNEINLCCDICFKEFSNIYNLVRHKKYDHLGQKPTYNCNYCCKNYRDKESFIKHVKRHTQIVTEKSFQCLFCGSLFVDNVNRKRHIKYHCRKNPNVVIKNKIPQAFICDLCDKMYTRKDSLEKHIRGHFGMTHQYKCNDCNKKYTTKHNLNAHVKTKHLKKKTHVCNTCDRQFFSRWGMLNHKRKCRLNKCKKYIKN